MRSVSGETLGDKTTGFGYQYQSTQAPSWNPWPTRDSSFEPRVFSSARVTDCVLSAFLGLGYSCIMSEQCLLWFYD